MTSFPGSGDPQEPATQHDGCECEVCCPPCMADNCWSFDVTARRVWLGYGVWARLLLCDVHGARHPFAHGPLFSALEVVTG